MSGVSSAFDKLYRYETTKTVNRHTEKLTLDRTNLGCLSLLEILIQTKLGLETPPTQGCIEMPDYSELPFNGFSLRITLALYLSFSKYPSQSAIASSLYPLDT